MSFSDKQQLLKKLKELGYDADMQDGVPYIFNVSFSIAEKTINEIGYIGSFGVKNKKDMGLKETDL